MIDDIKFYVSHELSPKLKSEFKNFEKNNVSNVFQSFEWIEYWCNIYDVKNDLTVKLFFVFVYSNDELILMLPLYIKKKKFNIKILKFIGDPYDDLNFPIVKKNLELDYLRFNLHFDNFLKLHQSEFDLILLRNLLPELNSTKNPLIQNKNYLKSNINYFFKMDNMDIYSNDKYSKDKNIKKNNESYRKTKSLKKIGKISYFFNDKKNASDIINFVIGNKDKQFKKKKRKNIFYFKQNVQFIKNIHKFDFSCFCYLMLDKTIISAHIGYIYKDTFYHIMPTHDVSFNKYSPGYLLLENMLNNSLNLDEINSFNFTIGSENYKKKWSNSKNYLYTVISSTNFKGFFYSLYLKVKYRFTFKYKLKSK